MSLEEWSNKIISKLRKCHYTEMVAKLERYCKEKDEKELIKKLVGVIADMF